MSAPAHGIVDYWCNAFTPERRGRWDAALAAQGVPLSLRAGPDDSFCTASEMVERMDELGIATLVLPVADPHGHGEPTDFSAVCCLAPVEAEDLATSHPGRFVGSWSYDPLAGGAAVHRAREALSWDWIIALHLHTHSFDRALDHADHYPFYALASAFEVPVIMQAGTSGGLQPSECGRPLGIDRPAIYFPDVNFVLSHLGWPWSDEAVAMALKFPNVFLGSAVYPRRHWAPTIESFLHGPGRRKMLFGSGFPAATHRRLLAQLDEPAIEPATRTAYLGDTARSVFGRLA